jgi:choline dehydrogenase
MATRVDFIVVGAGTAGSGMAGRLAQAGRTCLVVEAGGSDARSAGEIAAFIRATAHTIYHPVGTCRMGSDSSSVVDADLRVRGVDRLWIADASVMPAIPRGHPNAVIAAIADRGARLILAAAGA